jgi:hypothetical protein
MKYRIIIVFCLYIAGINQICFGQKLQSTNQTLPIDLKPSFPSSGYLYSKSIANYKKSEQKNAIEKQLLPINGKIEFITSSETRNFYSFLVREDNMGIYFIDIRNLQKKYKISDKDTITAFYSQKISPKLVDELFHAYIFLIENFKSKEVSVVSFGGIEVVFRCFKGHDYWEFTAQNPTGGEFLDLTNICYSIIRDCSNNTFDEQKCIDQLNILKIKYAKKLLEK